MPEHHPHRQDVRSVRSAHGGVVRPSMWLHPENGKGGSTHRKEQEFKRCDGTNLYYG